MYAAGDSWTSVVRQLCFSIMVFHISYDLQNDRAISVTAWNIILNIWIRSAGYRNYIKAYHAGNDGYGVEIFRLPS